MANRCWNYARFSVCVSRWISPYNKDGLLAPGMYADVIFSAKGNPEAFTVPKSAVVTSTERKYVLCVRDGKTVKFDVETGKELGDKIEVIGARPIIWVRRR